MTSIVGVPTGRLTDTECYNRKGGVSCGGGGPGERGLARLSKNSISKARQIQRDQIKSMELFGQ